MLTNFHLPRSTLFMLVAAFSGLDRMHSGTQHLHPVHVQFLSVHVFTPHVDLRPQSESRASHSGSNPVLSRPCFSNDPSLSHFLGKESLAESIVDLVSTSVQEILSLQVDSSASNVTGQIGSKVQGCWSAGETIQPARQFFLERQVLRELVVCLLKCSQWLHQGLRDILPSIPSELARLRTWPRFYAILQALTRSLTFPSMSDDFIIEVPTRKAFAPAALSRLISCGDSIPLSETTGLSMSTFSARISSVIARSRWKVDRFRLLIP